MISIVVVHGVVTIIMELNIIINIIVSHSDAYLNQLRFGMIHFLEWAIVCSGLALG